MLEIGGILVLGVGAQLLAWRLKLPSILLLLLLGFIAGPLTGHRFLDPDALFGDALLPLVSLAVATILLEGGLSLRFDELRGAGPAVRNLVLLGTPVTWILAAIAARLVLGFDWPLALLLGAILVVTGPTVIIPLLNHVRPTGAVGSVVRWEGIVGDPIGATLAVLVYQAIVPAEAASGTVAAGLGKAVVIGSASGLAGAVLLVVLLRRNLVPDWLHSPTALAIGIATFVGPSLLQHESGLLSVTLMGVVLANQRIVVLEHVIEFKENLRTLLISCLFILLGARLPAEELRFDGRNLAFALVLILLVRPLMVAVATRGTRLSWRERVFVGWMAPRGIVAAAVASVFALELGALGYPDADRLVSAVFAVIVITVAVYGLTAGPLARRLGLAEGDPQGVLLVGAHPWARSIAAALRDAGVRVLLVDTSWGNVQASRMAGLPVHYGNVLSESLSEEAPLGGIGKLIALTYNDQVNSLACLRLAGRFGRASTYQLRPGVASGGKESIPAHLRGRLAFGELSFWDLEARFRRGAAVKATTLTAEFGLDDYVAVHGRGDAPVVPLFLLREGKLLVAADDGQLEPRAGDTLLALVGPEAPARAADPAPPAEEGAGVGATEAQGEARAEGTQARG